MSWSREQIDILREESLSWIVKPTSIKVSPQIALQIEEGGRRVLELLRRK